MRVPRWAIAAFVTMMMLITVSVGGVANWLFNQRDQVAHNKAAIHEIIHDSVTTREVLERRLAAAPRVTVVYVTVPAPPPTAAPTTLLRHPPTTQTAPSTPFTPTPAPTTPTSIPRPSICVPLLTNGCSLLGAEGVPPRVWIPAASAVMALGIILWIYLIVWRRKFL